MMGTGDYEKDDFLSLATADAQNRQGPSPEDLLQLTAQEVTA